MKNTLITVAPGRLLKSGESFDFSSPVPGTLSVKLGLAGIGGEVLGVTLAPEVARRWTPEKPGMYLAEFTADGETACLPLAVAAADWAVCQITVGAFTAEDYAETIHGGGVPANYYVSPNRAAASGEFTLEDKRWRRYEREFGDDIYPHVMAKDIGVLNPELAHDDANWNSLSEAEIEKRLTFFQAWWEEQGFQPLDRIATYTPCNSFINACRQVGIRVVHSVIPEQNWSDGEWVINHWGMPTCPFWFASDDFRKATGRTVDGVVGMTMNHYHVLLPHLTRWGDFVLSPSHFTRWIRAADSGETSTRFKQFLTDTVRGWKSLSGDPFFFVAGFEFGRTFGTANMTAYNRAGLEALIALGNTDKLIFATGRDVRAYYERHLPHHPETAFRQRDNWIGCTVNGKPGQAGDSVVVERRNYKSVIREGEILPFFYYDYLVEWKFDVADTAAPHDFAPHIRQELSAECGDIELRLKAINPLERTVPVALWDGVPVDAPFPVISLPALDDGRKVVLMEIPAGWSGDLRLHLCRVPPPLKRRDAIWKMQTFGEPGAEHTYLHLSAPLTKDVFVPITLGKQAVVDSATGSLGELEAGTHMLPFGPINGWYRFWGCGVNDMLPDENPQLSGAVLTSDWPKELAAHREELDLAAVRRIDPSSEIVYQVYCGAQLPLGTRSRAESFDLVVVKKESVIVAEKADGVVAFGPGRSFWYHPRGLPIHITGLDLGSHYKILLHTFDPLGLNVKYVVSTGAREFGCWKVPASPLDPGTFFEVELLPSDMDSRGEVDLHIRSNQRALLHWWKDKGYIAAVHALWIIKSPAKRGSTLV